MKKQFLCLLLVLAALLVLGITPAMADAPAATPITLGGSARAVIANGGDIAYFSFTPNETVNCSFYSTGNSDTYGYIYDADMTPLAYNDDSGEGSNFNVNYKLEAGNTYYFGARYYGDTSTGEFDVFLDYAHFLELKAENDETSIFVSYGEGATLRTTVESYPEGEIRYQWYQYTNEYNYNTLYGETGSSLTIDSVTDQLHFRCTARNDEFSSSVHFYVSVENHLTVQAVGDTELTVEGGKGVTLRVSASADHGDLQYSWQKRAYEKGY